MGSDGALEKLGTIGVIRQHTDSISLHLAVSGRYYHPLTVIANETSIEFIMR